MITRKQIRLKVIEMSYNQLRYDRLRLESIKDLNSSGEYKLELIISRQGESTHLMVLD